ncbi:hypothetical protein HUF18_04850 [Thalassolituus sp. ST750PaO-4]|uniref:hypothetical protein n=1 Tax=Thalassolituus sp. ST750PaO-4 TaxID=2742965 RepID=UPI001CE2BC52|nr:hypothetical protein [Thalassolituus sp. ST750PaO-4]MCA6059096.1 hypothetical protein [Thalassolituus sp. ST750PaO-4]
MKIVQSQVQLSAQQKDLLLSARLSAMSVSVTAGDGENDGSNPASGSSASAGIQLSLSTRTESSQAVSRSSSVTHADGSQQQSSSAYLAQQLTEQTTQLNVIVSAVNARPGSAGLGVQVEVQSVLQVEREESLVFEALGQVQTEDGRQIDFMLALDFSRYTRAEQTNLFQGQLNLIDPLMINLNGGAVELSDQSFSFDLNADGQSENIARTAAGSGYLVFDKNNNGIIDDGSEMFGPQSGNGFADLAQYDDDGNGWIDENDAIFSQLSLMEFDDEGPTLRSAAEAGLGALYLGSAASDYELKNDAGQVRGVIARSGVALNENGEALLLQEVHLNTPPELPQYAISGGNLALSSEQGTINLQSPLSFFQFDNELLNSRDEQTRVQLRFEPEQGVRLAASGPLPGTADAGHHAGNSTHNNTRSNNNGNAGSNAIQGRAPRPNAPLYDDLQPRRMNMRQWAADAINRYHSEEQRKPSGKDAHVYVDIPDPVRAIPLNLRNEIEAGSKDMDNKLNALRATIEELKQMREQQQQSQKPLALYQAIGHLQG